MLEIALLNFILQTLLTPITQTLDDVTDGDTHQQSECNQKAINYNHKGKRLCDAES